MFNPRLWFAFWISGCLAVLCSTSPNAYGDAQFGGRAKGRLTIVDFLDPGTNLSLGGAYFVGAMTDADGPSAGPGEFHGNAGSSGFYTSIATPGERGVGTVGTNLFVEAAASGWSAPVGDAQAESRVLKVLTLTNVTPAPVVLNWKWEWSWYALATGDRGNPLDEAEVYTGTRLRIDGVLTGIRETYETYEPGANYGRGAVQHGSTLLRPKIGVVFTLFAHAEGECHSLAVPEPGAPAIGMAAAAAVWLVQRRPSINRRRRTNCD
ncbi:MAG: hypothetical protein WD851_07985 [Pirellulales bacterium]